MCICRAELHIKTWQIHIMVAVAWDSMVWFSGTCSPERYSWSFGSNFILGDGPWWIGIQDGSDSAWTDPVQLLPLVTAVQMKVEAAFTEKRARKDVGGDFPRGKTSLDMISLVVQWLKLCAPNAGGPSLIPGQEMSSHMLQLKIPHDAMEIKILHDATKTLCR